MPWSRFTRPSTAADLSLSIFGVPKSLARRAGIKVTEEVTDKVGT